jgi:DNA-binding NarL/FixJ family response regulator
MTDMPRASQVLHDNWTTQPSGPDHAGLRVLILCDKAETGLRVTKGGPISLALVHSWLDVSRALSETHIDVLVLESFDEATLDAGHIAEALRRAPDLHIALAAQEVDVALARLALRKGVNGIILVSAAQEVMDTPLRMVAEGKVYIDSSVAGQILGAAGPAGTEDHPVISLTDTVALVADDDEYFRMALSSILLEKFGFAEVFEANSLDEAERVIEGCDRIDLALFDLRMPGMSGAASLGRIRRMYPEVRKMAVISASQDRNDVLQSLSVGTYGYVVKAEGGTELQLALTQMLQGRIYAPALLHEPPETTEESEAPAVVLTFERGENVQYGADAEDVAEAARYVPQPAADVVEEATGSQEYTPQEDAPHGEARPELSPRQRRVLELLVQGMSNKEIAREMNLGIGTVKVHVTALFTKLGVSNRTSAVAVGAPLLQV